MQICIYLGKSSFVKPIPFAFIYSSYPPAVLLIYYGRTPLTEGVANDDYTF